MIRIIKFIMLLLAWVGLAILLMHYPKITFMSIVGLIGIVFGCMGCICLIKELWKFAGKEWFKRK